MKNITQNIFLLFVSTVFTFFLLELTVRSFFPQNIYPFVYKDDQLVSYRLKENYRGIHKAPEFKVKVETNSDGLRDYEHSLAKPDDVYRILVIGDSFTFGEGVEMKESYPKVMERRLNEVSTNRQYEVINASAFDWSTSEEYLYLKYYGIKYNPDMVILGFYMGNDICQNRFWLFAVNKGELVYTERKSVNARLNSLLKHVPGYMYIRERSESLALLRININRYFQRDIFKTYPEMMMSLYSGKPNQDARIAIENTEKLVMEMKKLSVKEGFNLALMLLPTSEQLNGVKFGSSGNLKLDYPNSLMRELGKKTGVPVLDLLHDFRQRGGAGKGLYYEINDHWNRGGHLLAGEASAERLLPLIMMDEPEIL